MSRKRNQNQTRTDTDSEEPDKVIAIVTIPHIAKDFRGSIKYTKGIKCLYWFKTETGMILLNRNGLKKLSRRMPLLPCLFSLEELLLGLRVSCVLSSTGRVTESVEFGGEL